MPSPEQLVRSYHRHLLAIRARASTTTGQLWDRFGGADDEALEEFPRHAAPVVAGAQRATVPLMAGYLSLLTGTRVALDPTQVLGLLRNGTPSTDVYSRPVISLRSMLSDGKPYTEALDSARSRATSTAATDVMLANREAAREGMAQEPRIVGYERVLSGNSCPFCATASTQRYNSDDLLPIHPHCVPAGSTISPAGLSAEPTNLRWIKAMTRRWHVGDLTVLDTASGEQLSVTPNHPVLTTKGWIPASLVSEGDELLRHDRLQRKHGSSPHERQRPFLIEDVWRALCVAGRLVRMPLAAEDLHGERAQGEVDVVWADGDLATINGSSLIKPADQLSLVHGHARRSGFSREGAPAALLDRVESPCTCEMGSGRLSLSLLRSHFGGSQQSRSGAVSRLNAPHEKFSLETGSIYASSGLDAVRRLTGHVEADRVVKAGGIGFRGHVYNLHTTSGVFAAGCHIVSNCDCGVAPIIGTKNPGRVINRDLLKDLKSEGGSSYWKSKGFTVDESGAIVRSDGDPLKVTVHEHGELGPVLTDSRHDFTGPQDL